MDQCKHCTLRGDLVACKKVSCTTHESWFVFELEKENKVFKDHLKALVNKQAKDYGLWFTANTAPEAYLQHALRTLHSLIEGDE